MLNGNFILLGTHYTSGGFMGEGSSYLSISKVNDNSERVWQRNIVIDYYSDYRNIAVTQLTDGSYIILNLVDDYDYISYSLSKILPE